MMDDLLLRGERTGALHVPEEQRIGRGVVGNAARKPAGRDQSFEAELAAVAVTESMFAGGCGSLRGLPVVYRDRIVGSERDVQLLLRRHHQTVGRTAERGTVEWPDGKRLHDPVRPRVDYRNRVAVGVGDEQVGAVNRHGRRVKTNGDVLNRPPVVEIDHRYRTGSGGASLTIGHDVPAGGGCG